MGILEQFRKAGGEDQFGNRPGRRSASVRVTVPVDGIMTEVDINAEQWESDRATLAHHIKLMQGDLARLADLADTAAEDLEVHPHRVARAIARELYDRAARLGDAAEGGAGR